MNRRYGDFPDENQTCGLRPGAYAILARRGHILLTYQGGESDEVQLPGGGIDPGESPITALHREVFEETGWHIARPRRIANYRRYSYSYEDQGYFDKSCTIYLAHPVLRIDDPTEADHTAFWAPQDLAVELLGPAGDRAILAKWIKYGANMR